MTIKIYQLSHWLWKHHVPVLPKVLSLLNRILFATHIPASVSMGKDVQLSYYGLGTVIHHRAVIGNRVVLGSGTVVGGRSGYNDVPIIEDDVEIGVGAKVLGPIRIGKGRRDRAGPRATKCPRPRSPSPLGVTPPLPTRLP